MSSRTIGYRPWARQRFFHPSLALLIGLLAALMLPASAFAIDEFPLPTPSSQPSGIAVGPDGALWFTEENSPPGAKHKIGRITTAGSITEFLIPADFATPSKIVTGPDGALWFTEHGANPPRIGRLDPAAAVPGTSNGITEFPPAGLATGSAPDGITTGPDGALWFTEYGSSKIGRITTTGSITEYPLPATGGFKPGDIDIGPDGRLWFAETEAGKIGVIDPAAAVPGASNGITEFDRPGADPSGITASGASIWFTQLNANKVEQMSTSGAKLAEFPTGTGPSGITFGPDGALWFTETGASKIGRLTTGGGFNDFTIPTASSDPSDIVAGPDGALWFTEFFGNKIGRIQAGSPGGGGGGTLPLPPPVTQSGKPSVLALAVSPSAFRAAKAGASISAKVGTKVTYRLSVAASVRFTVERESAGRKKGKKCVKQTPRNRKAKRCKLYKAARGSFIHSGKAGSNSFNFTGRIGGKSLKPGRYRLVAVATAGSSKSTLKQASFRIVRR